MTKHHPHLARLLRHQHRLIALGAARDPEHAVELEASYQVIQLARQSQALGLLVLKLRHDNEPWTRVLAAVRASLRTSL